MLSRFGTYSSALALVASVGLTGCIVQNNDGEDTSSSGPGAGTGAGGGGGGDTSSTGTGNQPTGTMDIDGRVVDDAGIALAGASVTTNFGDSAITDANGLFQFRDSPTGRELIVTITADDHAPQTVVVRGKAELEEFRLPVVLTRLIYVPAGNVEPTEYVYSSLGRDVTVRATPSADAPDIFHLRVAPIAVANTPGHLRPQGGGEGQLLQSSGMVYIDAVDEDGAPLAEGAVALEVDFGGSSPAASAASSAPRRASAAARASRCAGLARSRGTTPAPTAASACPARKPATRPCSSAARRSTSPSPTRPASAASAPILVPATTSAISSSPRRSARAGAARSRSAISA